jgi:hypothetical protein
MRELGVVPSSSPKRGGFASLCVSKSGLLLAPGETTRERGCAANWGAWRAHGREKRAKGQYARGHRRAVSRLVQWGLSMFGWQEHQPL